MTEQVTVLTAARACFFLITVALGLFLVGTAYGATVGPDPATIRVYPPGVNPSITPGPWLVIIGSSGPVTVSVDVDVQVVDTHFPYNIEFVAAMNNSKNPAPLPPGFSVVLSPGPSSSPGGPYFGGSGQSGTQPRFRSPDAYNVSDNPGVGGLGPDGIFPAWYFSYNYTFQSQLTSNNHFIQEMKVSVTVPAGMALPVRIVLLAWGPYSDTIGVETLVGYYATPWTGTTGIRVVPEFPSGSIMAVVSATGALLLAAALNRRRSNHKASAVKQTINL